MVPSCHLSAVSVCGMAVDSIYFLLVCSAVHLHTAVSRGAHRAFAQVSSTGCLKKIPAAMNPCFSEEIQVTQPPAYLDPSLPFEKRVDDLIGRMTLEEKVSQMLHTAAEIPRLGIPDYDWWGECLHGVARAGKATVFPQAIGLAATFDTDLVYRIADAISTEARAKFTIAQTAGNRARYLGLTFWTPNINIFRDPRWGRGQETYGEDPFLTAETGAAFVKGLQGNHPRYLKTAACAKHFAVHSGPEKDRHTFDARVSLRDLHETYLPAFKRLVDEGVESVMGAYNRTNGEPCCASKALLVDTLRERWGFKGHVVSDCWAIRDIYEQHKYVATAPEAAALAVRRTCDLNCGVTYVHLLDAFKQGLITEEEIDNSVRRLFMTRFKLGLFDPPASVPFTGIGPEVIRCEEHRALSLEAARKSMVLLKNNGVLPFTDTITSIYVVGPNAIDMNVLLGNYYGLADHLVTVLEGIAARAPEGVTVEYKQGVLLARENVNPIDWTVGDAKMFDAVVAVLGLTPLLENEEGDAIESSSVGDRIDIELPVNQMAYLRRLKTTGRPLVVVLSGGSALAIPEVQEIADAIIYLWYPGELGGTAVAEILFGDVNPSGRLPVTFPKNLAQLPPYDDYAMENRTYRFMKEEPLYPFGFGLSYTSFKYESIRAQVREFRAGDPVTVEVALRNSGKRAGEEVVQVYLSDPEASARVPSVKLAAFRRVALGPGEQATIQVTIGARSFCIVKDNGDSAYEPGTFVITAAGSCPVARSVALGAAEPVRTEVLMVR